MKIQTLSIVAGSRACNGRCPFCVSKMTPEQGTELEEPSVNWRNFLIACKLAKQAGCTTAMFTGKGEPMLFPGQISVYMSMLQPYNFPFIEMQTNGLCIRTTPPSTLEQFYTPKFLKQWYDMGMTHFSISIVHYDPEKNREIITPHMKKYIDLPALIRHLHDIGFSVRLSCVMIDGYIDSPEEIDRLIQFEEDNSVEQLTLRPVGAPAKTDNIEAKEWVDAHRLSPIKLGVINNYIAREGVQIMTLPHAVVYDMRGHNVCMTDCLTIDKNPGEMRDLIFFPDGHLRYSWEYGGAILL